MTVIATITQEAIQNQIFTIRGMQVMLDRDLAILYNIPTKALNQAVKRNIRRFPERFCFELNKVETDELVTGCDRFKSLKHSTSQVKAFSEQGIALLSTVLRSEIAIEVSIQIMDAFVEMRRFLRDNAEVFVRLETIYTQNINAQLKLDLNKYNLQYGPAVIKSFKDAHDQFLILDGTVVYHIGASLKDLGKKWFAFSKMEIAALDLLRKLK